MKISTKGRNAVRIMVEIARNKEEFISVADLSKKLGITIKYLEQIINKLAKSGLLESSRGKAGGYKLVKPAKEYSIGEILEVSGDSPRLANCLNHKECPMAENCDTMGVWVTLTNVINDFLKSVSLQDLIDKTYKKKK